MLNRTTVVATLAVLALTLSSAARAQTADYRTYFTFSGPVSLPGITLPAGRYLFRLADPDSSRKVISVLSGDGKTPLAMLHTIPSRLRDAVRSAEVRFMETPADVPPAIKTWWYPGTSTGYEFIYPRSQAVQLAKLTSEPVLTTSTETKDLETAELARISAEGVPSPVVVVADPPPVLPTGRVQQGEVAPTGGSGATAAVAQDPRSDDIVRRTARTRLPETGRVTPGAVWLGAFALCVGLGVWVWPRRRLAESR